jgi:PDZ domain-containing protein
MSRRSWTLVVAGLLLVALASVVSLLPVPYARLIPGPTTNTLGSENGKPLITIKGHETFPAKGRLDLTTVRVTTSDYRMGLVEALAGWLASDVAIVPRETVHPDDLSPEEIKKQNAEEMELSQQHATYAALRQLGIPAKARVVVASVVKETPAVGRLHAADVVVAVDGARVRTPDDVRNAVRRHRPGEDVTFDVLRGGAEKKITVRAASAEDDPERAFVGIEADQAYDFPFTIDIQLDDVGGPSAGLMFALGIVEKLDKGDVAGGATIAGSGTIDDSGAVGPVGGVGMKILGAKRAGATAFLVPEGNCRAAVASAPDDIRLIRVGSLRDALRALQSLRSGASDVPAC